MTMATLGTRAVCFLQLLIAVCWADHHMENMTITISNLNGESRTELLFDGVYINRPGTEFTVPLRNGVSLLGVNGIGAVFLVKTSDNFVSDAVGWRCTTDPDGPNEWWSLWYDDSRWPAAKVITASVPAALQPAMWITAEGARTSGAGRDWVYCRGAYGTPPNVNLTGAGSPGDVEVYYDGTSQGKHSSVWTMPLPPHVTLVAMQTFSTDTSALIASSTDSELVTPGDLWRCSEGKQITEDTLWMDNDFDDSTWLPPMAITRDIPEKLTRTGAKWIRAKSAGTEDLTYCRANYSGPQTMTTVAAEMTTAEMTTADSGAGSSISWTKILPHITLLVICIVFI